jgi:DNA-binding transcriptional ArsR family regulator
MIDGLLIAPPEVLKLAAHPIRWSVLTRLARSDYRVQELVAFLQLPQNLVSYHLRQLRATKLVMERKSSADERSIYYCLDVEQFRALYPQAGEQLHPALTEVPRRWSAIWAKPLMPLLPSATRQRKPVRSFQEPNGACTGPCLILPGRLDRKKTGWLSIARCVMLFGSVSRLNCSAHKARHSLVVISRKPAKKRGREVRTTGMPMPFASREICLCLT